MTDYATLSAAIERLETKVDKIDAKADARDQQAYQMQEFIGLLKQQLHYLQTSLDDIKAQIAASAHQADRATSTVRVDLERQIAVAQAEGERVHAEHQKDLDILLNPDTGAFARLARVDSTIKTVGAVGGAVGTASLAGIVALAVKAFGG